MDNKRVIDYLNDLLSIETYASETYPQFADQTDDSGIAEQLAEFGRDSERHRDLVADLIAHLGAYPSAGKELSAIGAAWTTGLANTVRRGTLGDFRNLQDLLFAEYRDRAHWSVLQTVAETTANQQLAEAVASVLPDEEKHVAYLEQKVRDLARAALTG